MVEVLVAIQGAPPRRRPTLTRWRLIPVADLMAAGGDDETVWEAQGLDPQFAVALDHGQWPLEPGWYRLRGVLQELAGRLTAPCLYPDYGDGIAEATRIDIEPAAANGEIDSVVHFSRPLHAVRFDPSTTLVRFRVRGLEVFRLGEREALWLLLRRAVGERLAAAPDKALTLVQEASARRLDERTEQAIQELIQVAREDALSGAAAYAIWAARDDRLLAELAGPWTGRSSDEPVLSLVLHDSQDADFAVCLSALSALAGQPLEILGDRRQLAAWPTGISMPAFREVATDLSLAARLRQAQGRFVGALAADDRVQPALVALLARLDVERPEAALVYSDEDRIDAQGVRFAPMFKPAWDPLLWCEQDFLGRSALVRRSSIPDALLDRLDSDIPWFSLLCGLIETLGTPPLHIPHVLRHMAGALGPICAPFARMETDMAARARLLSADRVEGARVEVIGDGRLRMRVPTEPAPAVDIVIPTRDRTDLLELCVSTLLTRTAYPNYRVTIVDNGSVEPASHAYFAKIAVDPRIRVLAYDQPFNYSAINNYAVVRCDGDVVVLLNNDIEIIDEAWLDEMVSLAMQPRAGAIGAKLYYPDGSLQHAGVVLGVGGVAAHAFAHQKHGFDGQYGRALLAQRYSAVTAACLAVRREAYLAVGGLDESIAVSFNDVDFCLRLLAQGYVNAWTPHARAYHHESASRGAEDNPVKQARFAAEVVVMRARWGHILDLDPAYNPNLSLRGAPFGLDAERHSGALIRDMQQIYPSTAAPYIIPGKFPEI